MAWSEDDLREYHAKRQGRAEAKQEARQHQVEARRSKYRNKKIQIDGRTFDSKLEAKRYVELKRLQEAGVISALQCQVRSIWKCMAIILARMSQTLPIGMANSGLWSKTPRECGRENTCSRRS